MGRVFTGFVGAQFKGFSSQADADTYMQHNSSILPVSSISHSKEKRVVSKRSHDDLIDLTIEKRQRLSECIVISDDEVIVTAPVHTGPLCIFTDGACSSNGKSGARGGVGVYFGKNNPRNISEPLKGSYQTNNRAELTAIIRALDVCVNEPKAMMKPGVKIFSDSKYCIDGATKWMKGWERKAWKKSDGSGVLNCDLWKVLCSRIRVLQFSLEFVCVLFCILT
jgi:ribonuclease HI